MSETQNVEHDLIMKVYQDGLVYSINKGEKTASLIGCKSEAEELIIPRSVIYESTEYAITRISRYSFSSKRNLKLIKFPSNSELRTIENQSFFNSTIECISIPSKCIELQDGFFSSLDNLKDIKISKENPKYSIFDGKMLIGKSSIENDNYDNLIYYFKKDEKITIPSFIEIISPFAFTNSNVREISFKNDSKLRTIEKNAFSTFSIKNITIPSKCIELKDGWLNGTSKLPTIQISPENRKYSIYGGKFIVGKSKIESENFDTIIECLQNFEEITVPSFIEIIGAYSFIKCSNLHKISFENDSKLRSIEKFAFKGCDIECLSIPPHLSKIGEASFCQCIHLKTVIIPENSELQIIEKEAFRATEIERISIPAHLRKIGETAFFNCQKLRKVEISENSELEVIGPYAFSNTSIEEFFIPSKCIKLEKSWCNYIQKVKKVKISSENLKYSVYQNKFIIGKSVIDSEKYDILVNCIQNYRTIKIPPFIESIGPFCFYQFKNLRKITFSIHSKIRIIDEYAFFESSIESFSIPSHVTEICKYAFFNCQRLQKVEMTENSELKKIGEFSFASCSFDRIFIPSNIKIISRSAFVNCKNLKIVDFQCNSNLRIIDNDSFAQTSIEKISIPKNVARIGESAFHDCKKLREIEFDKNSELQIIEKDAFGSSSIEKVEIPSNVEQICEGSFSFCSELKKVGFEGNSKLQIIEEKSFFACKIECISIPDQVKVIGKEAFSKCSNLKIIELNENLINDQISINMFKNCNKGLIVMIPSKINYLLHH